MNRKYLFYMLILDVWFLKSIMKSSLIYNPGLSIQYVLCHVQKNTTGWKAQCLESKVLQYLKGKVVLSICMHTRKGYSENWTVVMKSSAASVSKLTSIPALTKSRSTVTLPVTTRAPLWPKPIQDLVRMCSIGKVLCMNMLRCRLVREAA